MAVIDIGSNSLRMVVFAGDQAIPTTLHDEKHQIGLGRDLVSTGRLHAPGVPVALDHIRRMVALAEAMGVERLALLATAAVRQAEDGRAFAALAQELCGHPVRILSGIEEAGLAAQGVLWGNPTASGLFGDLGGGSLELAALREGRTEQRATLPLGPLVMSEPDGFAADKSLGERIDEALGGVPWLSGWNDQPFIASGGAWRSLAKMHMEWNDYPLRNVQGFDLSAHDARTLTDRVARRGDSALDRVPGVSGRRRERLPYAAFLLGRVMRVTRSSRLCFSAFGLREGWLWEQRKDQLG